MRPMRAALLLVPPLVPLLAGCLWSAEQRCDQTSKSATVWCEESKICYADTGDCPETAVSEEECARINESFTATEKGQVWEWNEETQTCEDVS